MDGKICIVTGAGQGIGRAIAVELARAGAAAVAVIDISEEGGNQTAQLVREAGAKGDFIRTDLMKAAEIDKAIGQVAEQHGGIDVLVNNAGIIETAISKNGMAVSTENMEEEVWDTVLGINLKAMWLATKFAAPHLRRSKRGPSVVNASSVAGMVGFAHSAAYNASKGGVIQLTKSMAVDLAPDVRCNCYLPGLIDTPMARNFLDGAEDREAVMKFTLGTHLIPRLGLPEEVAKLVTFLASNDSGFMTGAAIPVDGGTLAWRGTNA
jgi:NAD(P)-dependent dehydrogenase (short-subunit alcohol dehydrogenase family)